MTTNRFSKSPRRRAENAFFFPAFRRPVGSIRRLLQISVLTMPLSEIVSFPVCCREYMKFRFPFCFFIFFRNVIYVCQRKSLKGNDFQNGRSDVPFLFPQKYPQRYAGKDIHEGIVVHEIENKMSNVRIYRYIWKSPVYFMYLAGCEG